MFLDGRFPSLAKTATDIAVVGMFLDKSDKGWFLTESLWGPQGSVLKREPRVRDLARLLSCVLGQEALLSKCVHPVYPQEYNWVPTNCQESLTKCLKGRGGAGNLPLYTQSTPESIIGYWQIVKEAGQNAESGDLPLSIPGHLQGYSWVLANCQGSLTKCWGGDGPAIHQPPNQWEYQYSFVLHLKETRKTLAGWAAWHKRSPFF